VVWVMFTVFYVVIPNARVRFPSALMAGIVAGTAFALFQWGYLYVQRWMTSYNAIYGSFAALPLFMIWMQTSWQILLFGGELSFAYQNVSRFCEERESLRISYDQRRKVLVAVMLIVVEHLRTQGGATPVETIRDRLDLPTRIVNDILYQLVQADLLLAVPVDADDREKEYIHVAYGLRCVGGRGAVGERRVRPGADARVLVHRPRAGAHQAACPQIAGECEDHRLVGGLKVKCLSAKNVSDFYLAAQPAGHARCQPDGCGFPVGKASARPSDGVVLFTL